MDLELNKNKMEIFQNERLISQSLESKPTLQHIFNTIVQQIIKAKEEQSLNFTLSKEDAHLVLELLAAGTNSKELGKT